MRFIILAYPLAILLDILVMMNFLTWHEDTVKDYTQRQMDLQVNYACDASAQMMLKRTSDIESDYVQWGSIHVDPVIAYNTYEECMLRSLDWGISEENKAAFKEMYVPFFCVVGHDGYYLFEKTMKVETTGLYDYVELSDPRPQVEGVDKITGVDESGNTVLLKPVLPDVSENRRVSTAISYPLEWTPKMPFTYDDGDGNYFAINLTYDWCVKYSLDTDKIDTKYYPKESDGIPEWKQRTIVSNVVSEACSTALRMSLLGDTFKYLYIPDTLSDSVDTNPIVGPTVITYVDGRKAGLDHGLNSFAVGGAKIDNQSNVICYVIDGVRFYTYAYNRDKLTAIYGYRPDIIRQFLNPREAAENGYWFDMSTMDT